MSIVLAFRTVDPLRVVLAADSIVKTVDANSNGVRTGRSEAAKIRAAGRWTLVAGGFSGISRNFNTLDELAHGVRDCATADDAIAAMREKFVRTIAPHYAEAVRTVPTLPLLFNSYIGGLISCWFAGVDERTGVLTLSNFEVTIAGRQLSMHGGSVPGHAHDGLTDFFFANGQMKAIRLVNQQQPDWLRVGDVDAARRVLREQYSATPNNVAPPWHFVEIDADGKRTWHEEGEAACA